MTLENGKQPLSDGHQWGCMETNRSAVTGRSAGVDGPARPIFAPSATPSSFCCAPDARASATT